MPKESTVYQNYHKLKSVHIVRLINISFSGKANMNVSVLLFSSPSLFIFSSPYQPRQSKPLTEFCACSKMKVLIHESTRK